MIKYTTILIICLLVFTSRSFADDSHSLEKIVVTPSRLSGHSSDSMRPVTVLDRKGLLYSVYSAFPDKIANLGGLDIRRRGPEGVQSDISIRGATFEQNSVLIDGVIFNDPQTGHFNTDLPLTSMDIDRVEILRGPGSSLYGANAFGGVVNTLVRKPQEREVVVKTEGGSFDYLLEGFSATLPLGVAADRFSIESAKSGGYLPETEYDIMTLSNDYSIETPFGKYDALFGYQKKVFGAGSFYSNLYPNQEEQTDTRLFKIEGDLESDSLRFRPKIYLRRHRDKFALDRNRPGWQTNYHTTYIYGLESGVVLNSAFSDVAYGFDLSGDSIDSTNLQTHHRGRGGAYVEISPRLMEGLSVSIGMREDYFSDFGWQYAPSVGASYALLEPLTIRGLVGRAYRVPTFTDLYYNDAANNGNSFLRPESSLSYEAGLDSKLGQSSVSFTYFRRDSSDAIDWIRYSTRSPWQASNIGSAITNGIELNCEIKPGLIGNPGSVERIFVNYTAIDTYAKHDYMSKYALDYLKQQIASGVELDILDFKSYCVINYKKRVGDSGFIVVDVKIAKEIIKRDGILFQAFFDVGNLFDVKYSEQSNIEMPGRWLKAGASLRF